MNTRDKIKKNLQAIKEKRKAAIVDETATKLAIALDSLWTLMDMHADIDIYTIIEIFEGLNKNKVMKLLALNGDKK